MDMTFEQYITNPMGNRVMGNTSMYREMYSKKLDALLVREQNKINYFLFTDKKQDRYIAYIKVPSESVKDFYYDCVIEFSRGDKNKASLDDYKVRFYTNEPRFVYVFCYSFIENDLFFTDLESKMSKIARTQSAQVTNASNQVGYVKSIFFAYLIMKHRGMFTKMMWEYEGREYKKQTLLSMIEHSSVKQINRQQMEKDQKEDQRKFNMLKKSSETNPLHSTKPATTKMASKVKTVPRVKRR